MENLEERKIIFSFAQPAIKDIMRTTSKENEMLAWSSISGEGKLILMFRGSFVYLTFHSIIFK